MVDLVVHLSQELVYLLLRELGGTAFTTEIRRLAKEKYPEATLYTYVADRLRRLAKWGYIRKNPDKSFTIVSNYP